MTVMMNMNASAKPALPDSIEAVEQLLERGNYVADRALATTLFLSLRMGRPLFLEGEAGTGKTEIAKVLSETLGRRLLRLQCYEGLDIAAAVYDWNYARQMIEIRLAEAAGIGTTIVPPLVDAQGPISSTRIRRALQDGYPERATAMLGRPWEIRGEVVHGDKLGRVLGWPTANMWIGRHLEPARGVYAVTVALPDGTEAKGVANVGRRPTLGGDPETRLETYIFDWSGDIYGREIGVRLVKFLRPDAKFAGLEELKAAIAQDAENARAALG